MDRAVMYALVIFTTLVPLVIARRVSAGKLPVRRGLLWTVCASSVVIGGWLLAVWLVVPRLL